MKKIYIFGHQKPDTDSVTSAIALSYLKNQLGFKTEPRVLGDINLETKFALDYFQVPAPKYLNDVKLQIKDIKYYKNYFLSANSSVKETYEYMMDNGITGIPLVDSKGKFVTLVTIKNITNDLIDGNFNSLKTSYDNILKTINGKEIVRCDDQIEGNILIAAYDTETFLKTVTLYPTDILITGGRTSIIKKAIESQVKLIVNVGGRHVPSELVDLAKENNVNLILSPYDTFRTSKLIGLSNYIYYILPQGRVCTFGENDYYDDFIKTSTKLKHNNYPVINSKGLCKGLLRVTESIDIEKKQVILVDHNEFDQSVEGLEEADIIEVVDHHKIGNISTNKPINFRNMSVGSTNTIVYQMYLESKVEIPKPIAGVMLSGILSDTLALTSPSKTVYDEEAVEVLSKIAMVEPQDYAIEMFKAGTTLEGRTKEEVINTDIKVYPIGDEKIAVSQVFTLDYEKILNEKDDYQQIIERIKDTFNYQMVILVVTDILKNGSYLFYTTREKEILEGAFHVTDLYQGYYLDGIVSRKKQIIPCVMEEMK